MGLDDRDGRHGLLRALPKVFGQALARRQLPERDEASNRFPKSTAFAKELCPFYPVAPKTSVAIVTEFGDSGHYFRIGGPWAHENAVLGAMSRLGGHNFNQSDNLDIPHLAGAHGQAVEKEGDKWCARRGSNSRPIAPEAIALSI